MPTGIRKITEPGTHMMAPAAAWSSSAEIPTSAAPLHRSDREPAQRKLEKLTTLCSGYRRTRDIAVSSDERRGRVSGSCYLHAPSHCQSSLAKVFLAKSRKAVYWTLVQYGEALRFLSINRYVNIETVRYTWTGTAAV